MRKRFAKPTSIAEVLGRATARLRIGDRMRRYALWEKWRSIVGSSIADHAEPSRWQGRTLVVRVDHPAWMQELGFLKAQIIKGIRKALPRADVQELRFEVGTLTRGGGAAASPPSPARRPPDDEEIALAERAASEIADPDLREIARRAMLRSFGANTRKR
jgi:Dna[CI] antecedent, DciA